MQPDATNIHTGHAVMQQNRYLMYSILPHTGNQGIRFSFTKDNKTTEPTMAAEMRIQTPTLLPANFFNDQ